MTDDMGAKKLAAANQWQWPDQCDLAENFERVLALYRAEMVHTAVGMIALCTHPTSYQNCCLQCGALKAGEAWLLPSRIQDAVDAWTTARAERAKAKRR